MNEPIFIKNRKRIWYPLLTTSTSLVFIPLFGILLIYLYSPNVSNPILIWIGIIFFFILYVFNTIYTWLRYSRDISEYKQMIISTLDELEARVKFGDEQGVKEIKCKLSTIMSAENEELVNKTVDELIESIKERGNENDETED